MLLRKNQAVFCRLFPLKRRLTKMFMSRATKKYKKVGEVKPKAKGMRDCLKNLIFNYKRNFK